MLTHREVVGRGALSFQRTVDRSLVHARNVRCVLLTDAIPIDSSSIEIAAQWPLRHDWCDYTLDRGVCVELMAETFRQAWILTAHVTVGAPSGTRVTMEELAITRIGTAQLMHPDPANVVLRMTVTSLKATTQGAVRMLTAEGEFLYGGQLIASGRGRGALLEPRVYSRLRQERPPRYPNVVPRAVKLITHDVRGPRLSAETAQERYFDHPHDHVPGMILVAAALQAADDPSACLTRSFDARFMGFVEHDERVDVEVHASGDNLAVEFRQLGQTHAVVRI